MHSVEAQRQAGWKRNINIQNLGNKSKQGPCTWCAHRVACGGAWHAYWSVRGGEGISPPMTLIPAWSPEDAGPHQHHSFARSIQSLSTADASRALSHWIIVNEWKFNDLQKFIDLGGTELIWVFSPEQWLSTHWKNEDFRTRLRLLRRTARALQQRDFRMHVFVSPSPEGSALSALEELFQRLDINLRCGNWPEKWPRSISSPPG